MERFVGAGLDGEGMPKGNKKAGFVGLMLAKKHLKKKPDDQEPPADKKKTPAKFAIRKIAEPSEQIKKVYSKKGSRASLSPEALAKLRAAEAERQRKSRARRKEDTRIVETLRKGSGETFIQEAVEGMKKGAFTKQALRAHKTPIDFAKQVLAHPDKFTETTRKRAQFLVNIQKKGGNKTKEDLAAFVPPPQPKKLVTPKMKAALEKQKAELQPKTGKGKNEDDLMRQANSLIAKQPMLPPAEVMNELEAILNEAEASLASPAKGLFGRSQKMTVEQAKKKMDDVIFRFERDYEMAEAEPKSEPKGSKIKKEFAQVRPRGSGVGKSKPKVAPETDAVEAVLATVLNKPVIEAREARSPRRQDVAKERGRQEKAFFDQYGMDRSRVAPDVQEKMLRGLKVSPPSSPKPSAPVEGTITFKRGKGEVKMPKSAFVKEHKKLIGLLTKVGKEGEEQKKELAKVLGKGKTIKTRKAKSGKPTRSFAEMIADLVERRDAIQEDMDAVAEEQGGQGFQGDFPEDVMDQMEQATDAVQRLNAQIAELQGREEDAETVVGEAREEDE